MFDYYASRLEEKWNQLSAHKGRLGIALLVTALTLWIVWLSVIQERSDLTLEHARADQEANHEKRDPEPAKGIEKTKETRSPTPIYVHVAGAVLVPGLYELAPGSRSDEAIKAAGGLLASADQTGVNLARKLEDGEQLIVPYLVSGAPSAVSGTLSTGERTAKTATLVNINKASVEELDSVPGIGPVTAEKIVMHRESSGSFASIEELKNVSGIGDKKYEDMAPYLVVR